MIVRGLQWQDRGVRLAGKSYQGSEESHALWIGIILACFHIEGKFADFMDRQTDEVGKILTA